ncbi:uncharacterized protein LOC117108874 [Anneissia japonica]|uniref:uncharacterized protein LOC117108874 n=1 Tax=Anneissia japonica TaxID=1529436 RepID=UPI0014257458|nr:uncharacterized protein LOC117108874 [Anneissia japonica]
MDHQTPIAKSVCNTTRTQDTAQRSDLDRRQRLDRKIFTLKKRQRLTASYQLVIFLASCLPTFILLGACSCRFIWESLFCFMFFVSAIFGMLAFGFSNKRWNIVYMINLVLSFFCALPMMLLSVLAIINKEKYNCEKNIETCENIMTVILCVNIMLAFVEVVVIFTALKISSRIILKLDERNVMNSIATRDNSADNDKGKSICDNKVAYYAMQDIPTAKNVDVSDVPPPPPALPPISSSEPSFQQDSSVLTSARYIPAPPQPPPIVPPAGFGNVDACYINDDICMTSNKKPADNQKDDMDNEGYLMPAAVNDIRSRREAKDTTSLLQKNIEGGILDKQGPPCRRPKVMPPKLPNRKILRRSRSEPFINVTEEKFSVICRGISIDDDNQKDDVDNEGYLVPTAINDIRSRREANETTSSLQKNVEGGILDKQGPFSRRPKVMPPKLPNRKILRRSRSEPFINVTEEKFSVICNGIPIDAVNVLTNNLKDDVITQKEQESSHYIELWKTSTSSKLKS